MHTSLQGLNAHESEKVEFSLAAKELRVFLAPGDRRASQDVEGPVVLDCALIAAIASKLRFCELDRCSVRMPILTLSELPVLPRGLGISAL